MHLKKAKLILRSESSIPPTSVSFILWDLHFLDNLLFLFLPPKLYFSPLAGSHQGHECSSGPERARPPSFLPEGKVKEGHGGKTSWGGRRRTRGWCNVLPVKLLIWGSFSLGCFFFLPPRLALRMKMYYFQVNPQWHLKFPGCLGYMKR